MFRSPSSFTSKRNSGYNFGVNSHGSGAGSSGSPSSFDSRSSSAAHSRHQSAGPASPLVELREALDRIEAIIEQARLAWEYETNGAGNTVGRPAYRQRRSSAKRKRRDKRSKSAAVSPNLENGSPISIGRPKARRRGSNAKGSKACFISMDLLAEEELVELLRRTAELVVTGERSAAIALSRASSEGGATDEADRHLAIFEYFCERNALHLIVNIVTGAAFSPLSTSSLSEPSSSGASGASDSDSDSDSVGLTLLPPLTVATQSIQSVSILIQNVSRATSLYFLLSNNRVNDLINFPLGLYAAAERSAPGNASGGHGAKDECSPEMGELSARFVSFLKSLAMRMNAETLQFFLTYPPQRKRRASRSSFTKQSAIESSGKHSSDECADDEVDDKSSFAAARRMQSPSRMTLVNFPLTSTDDEANKDEKRAKANRTPEPTIVLDPIKMGLCDVEFALYARALEFCSPEQDSFVRVTAMNICLNTLRLSTVDDRGSNTEVGDSDDAKSSSMLSNPAMTNTPDGTLHNMAALPLRERVAIARHVCDPSRVEGLVSPIFTKLAGLCGALEETVRDIDALTGMTNTESEEERSFSEQRKQKRRMSVQEAKQMDRLENNFKNISADLQDELMLLEDVLKVGLTSLNEQTIEMMMATFIYPLLLQPLLYLQRCNPQQRPFLDVGCGPSTSLSPQSSFHESDPHQHSESISHSYTNSSHPFSVDSLSTALARSGLLNEGSHECDTNGCKSVRNEDNHINLRLPFVENGQLPLSGENISDTDMAPVKTAFVGLAAVFDTVTHQPLLRLLLTALFHPLAPVTSGGAMIRCEPNVVCSDVNGKLHIRMDGAASYLNNNSVGLGKIYGTGIYNFGKTNDEQSAVSDVGSGNSDVNSEINCLRNVGREQSMCTFVMSPALADILNASVGDVSSTSLSTQWRENPYRRIALACIAGTDGMLPLRSISVLAIDAALSALDSRSIDIILFGKKMLFDSTDRNPYAEIDPTASVDPTIPPDESRAILSQSPTNGPLHDSNSSTKTRYMAEVIAALCISVMTASISVNGVWRLDFDQTAADALFCAAKICSPAATIATKLLNHRRLQSASFVSQLPSLINSESLTSAPRDSGSGSKKKPEGQDEEQLNVIMDRIFFDLLDESNRCVVEKLTLQRTQSATNDNWHGQFRVPVTMRSSLKKVLTNMCEDTLENDDAISPCKVGSLRFAAFSIFSHMQLDAFANLIKERSSKSVELLDRDSLKNDVNRRDDGTIMAHISQRLSASILERGKNTDSSLSSNGGQTLRPGSSVELVGRAAFPCVCEVSESSASLFSSHGATVAEGVTWQSLYLVVLGKYMFLAEPESGGPEGNGRIVMSCRLSCLTVEKDKPINANNGSTACRLILSYSSHDPQPPGVFYITQNKTDDGSGTRFTHGQMDVWFEDAKAAGHAFKVLAFKILKAKSNRGNGIREALTFDDQLQSSALFNGA